MEGGDCEEKTDVDLLNVSCKSPYLEQLSWLRQSVRHMKLNELEQLKVSLLNSCKFASIELERDIRSFSLKTHSTLDETLHQGTDALEALKKIALEILGTEKAERFFDQPDWVPSILAELEKLLQGKEEQAVELRQALDEKRAAFNMLEERLEEYEEKLKNANIEPSSNAYVTELEEMLSSRQATLKEQIEKNQELQQKLEALEKFELDLSAVDSSGTVPGNIVELGDIHLENICGTFSFSHLLECSL
ncbi:unnamed protein product [Enterobius vermicularis]|uniref:RH1 domain-containing protein n=1 Tax=Enterobius vermicularis TaxID=51028 RepID=A0A0N4UUT2_ENTVE|nr:unnamed protein product [Enterobius vermicularis]